ncbi:unnamed protein product [Malus baccata var. baccata]
MQSEEKEQGLPSARIEQSLPQPSMHLNSTTKGKLGSNSMTSNSIPTNTPFPRRFMQSKKDESDKDILDTFRKVQVNIPLLDAIKQVPKYAKFLKELCTTRKRASNKEVVRVSENVSAVLQRKLPPKCKDLVSFTIPCVIGNTRFESAMLDLGASINVMPYSIYASMNLGELKNDGVIIQLADRTNAYPKGVLDDVLVQEFLDDLSEDALKKTLTQSIGLKNEGLALRHTHGNNNEHLAMPIQEELVEMVAALESNPRHIGYNQIVIAPDDQEKTTFTSPFGTFAYRRMPFGLCNAPATFQRCMVSIFSEFVDKIIEVFMDDFSVFGDSFDACLNNLTLILQRCIKTNLVLNWEKCHFMVKQGIVLGHIISEKGIEVDKSKIDLVRQLPFPTSVREVRSFFGHAGFYRRFIKDFSKIAQPFCRLLQKEVAFEFNKEYETTFKTLKDMLTSAPIIMPPDWSLPFELMCDASDYAIALKYLLTKKEAKPRLIRWMLLLQEFNIEIRDKKGSENVVADHLNRLVHEEDSLPILETFPDEQLLSLEVSEPWYADLVNYLVTKQVPSTLDKYKRDKLINDARFYVWDDPYLWKYCPDQIIRRCVHNSEFNSTLAFCHSYACGGHFGTQRTTLKVLESGFYWPTLFKDARTFCITCDRCQRTVQVKSLRNGDEFKVNEHRLKLYYESDLGQIVEEIPLSAMGPIQA